MWVTTPIISLLQATIFLILCSLTLPLLMLPSPSTLIPMLVLILLDMGISTPLSKDARLPSQPAAFLAQYTIPILPFAVNVSRAIS